MKQRPASFESVDYKKAIWARKEKNKKKSKINTLRGQEVQKQYVI